MKRRVLALLLVLVLCPSFALSASARRQYIIPDSNTRYLTEGELWEWDYDSVGFIFNEIFARHGYNFEIGGRYDNYFRSRPWYTPNQNPNNSQACYPKMNEVEWANERLCKEVRADMRSLGTRNQNGKHYLDYIETEQFDVLSGFAYMQLQSGQKLPVYSAPDGASWRGANGKASVSTNGSVYVAGWESGWLLVMYQTNNNAVRVGYVRDVKGRVNAPSLQFVYQSMTLGEAANLTDDPSTSYTTICQLRAGDTVTYLTGFQNRRDWAYVQTTANGQTVRGFIPAEALGIVGETDNAGSGYPEDNG